MKYLDYKNKKKYFFNGGFSLIEMLVVVAIFLIMTSVILLRQSKFSSDLLVTNLAYEVALSIREMQVYGIGSKVSSGGVRNTGYGIHIASVSEKPESYLSFTDLDLDNTYDESDGEFLGPIDISRGQKIRKFCVKDSGDDYLCFRPGGGSIEWLDISFIKPNPDSHIWAGINGGVADEYDQALIVVESSLGDKCRGVLVTRAGQIEVETVNNPGVDKCVTYDAY